MYANIGYVGNIISYDVCTHFNHFSIERERDSDRDTERETERSNSKTLILKNRSVRSNWTYLTANPCYSTNTERVLYGNILCSVPLSIL